MALFLRNFPNDLLALITRFLGCAEIDLLTRLCGDKMLSNRLYTLGGVSELNFGSCSPLGDFRPQPLAKFLSLTRLKLKLNGVSTPMGWIAILPPTMTEIDLEFRSAHTAFARPLTEKDDATTALLFSNNGFTLLSVRDVFPRLKKLRISAAYDPWDSNANQVSLSPRFVLDNLTNNAYFRISDRMALHFIQELPDSIQSLDLSHLSVMLRQALRKYAVHLGHQLQAPEARHKAPAAVVTDQIEAQVSQRFQWPSSLIHGNFTGHMSYLGHGYCIPPRADMLEVCTISDTYLQFFLAIPAPKIQDLTIFSKTGCETLITLPDTVGRLQYRDPEDYKLTSARFRPQPSDSTKSQSHYPEARLPVNLKELTVTSWWRPVYSDAKLLPASLVLLHIPNYPASYGNKLDTLPPLLTSLDIHIVGRDFYPEQLQNKLRYFRLNWAHSITPQHLSTLPKSLETLKLVHCDSALIDIHMKRLPASITDLELETNLLLGFRCLASLPPQIRRLALPSNEMFADEHLEKLPKTLTEFVVYSLTFTFTIVPPSVTHLDMAVYMEYLISLVPQGMRDWSKIHRLVKPQSKKSTPQLIESLPAGLTALDLAHFPTTAMDIPKDIASMCPKLTALTVEDGNSPSNAQYFLPESLTSLVLPSHPSPPLLNAICKQLPLLQNLEFTGHADLVCQLPSALTRLKIANWHPHVSICNCNNLKTLSISDCALVDVSMLPRGLTDLELHSTGLGPSEAKNFCWPPRLTRINAPKLEIPLISYHSSLASNSAKHTLHSETSSCSAPLDSPFPTSLTSLDAYSLLLTWHDHVAHRATSSLTQIKSLPYLGLPQDEAFRWVSDYLPNLAHLRLETGLKVPWSISQIHEMPDSVTSAELTVETSEEENLAALSQPRLLAVLPRALTRLSLSKPIHFSSTKYMPRTLTDLRIVATGFNEASYKWMPESLSVLELNRVDKFPPKYARALPQGLLELFLDTIWVTNATLAALPRSLTALRTGESNQITMAGFALLPPGIRYIGIPTWNRGKNLSLKDGSLPTQLRDINSVRTSWMDGRSYLLDEIFHAYLDSSGSFAVNSN